MTKKCKMNECIDLSKYDEEIADYIKDQVLDRMDKRTLGIISAEIQGDLLVIETMTDAGREKAHEEVKNLVERIADEKETDIERERRQSGEYGKDL